MTSLSASQQQDPDSSPEMQLSWDAWHRRVAEALFTRFNFFAKAAFRYSPPLACVISYVVTREGQVVNVQMQQQSSNLMFNLLVSTVIKSINGDTTLLQFRLDLAQICAEVWHLY